MVNSIINAIGSIVTTCSGNSSEVEEKNKAKQSEASELIDSKMHKVSHLIQGDEQAITRESIKADQQSPSEIENTKVKTVAEHANIVESNKNVKSLQSSTADNACDIYSASVASAKDSKSQVNQNLDPYKLLRYAPSALDRSSTYFLWFLHQAVIREDFSSRPPEVQKVLKHMIVNAWRKGASKSHSEEAQNPTTRNVEYYRGNATSLINPVETSIRSQLPKAAEGSYISPKLALAEIMHQENAQIIKIDQLNFEDQIDLILENVFQEVVSPIYFDFSSCLSKAVTNGQISDLNILEKIRYTLHQKIGNFLANHPKLTCLEIRKLVFLMQRIHLIAFQKRSEGFVAIMPPVFDNAQLLEKSYGGKSIAEIIDIIVEVEKRTDEIEDSKSLAETIKENTFSSEQLANFEELVSTIFSYTETLGFVEFVYLKKKVVKIKNQIDQIENKWKKDGVDTTQFQEELEQLNKELNKMSKDRFFKPFIKIVQTNIEVLQNRIKLGEKEISEEQRINLAKLQQPFVSAVLKALSNDLAVNIATEGDTESEDFLQGINLSLGICPLHYFSKKGLTPSPDILISMLLDSSPVTLDELVGRERAELAPPLHLSKQKQPKVCADFKEFINQPLIIRFEGLQRAVPIQNENISRFIQSKAVVNLLKGLEKFRSPTGKTIDEVFVEKRILDLLQTSYYALALTMQEAIFLQDDDDIFNEKIEIMHQIIQDMLVIVQPYDDQTLSQLVTDQVQEAGIIPEGLSAKVNVHSSGMQSLATILTSVEAQKGDNHLNVVILKDTYYESTGFVQNCKQYQHYQLNGDVFNQEGIEKALTDKEVNAISQLKKDKKIDLFLCEFHHNIALNKDVYREENIIQQIKKMYERGLLADKCTVAIDTTLSGESASDIQRLLNDETIYQLIQEGKLNIVLIRSGQKFDLIGQDNYYCGFTTTISPQDQWQAFHASVNDPNNHIRGPSLQGIAHLHKYAYEQIHFHRELSIAATQEAYRGLNKKLLFAPKSKNFLQIARIEDDRIGFFDLKCSNKGLSKVIQKQLVAYAKTHNAAISTRPSFGFNTTNQIIISERRGSLKWRLNIVTHPEVYIDFFNKLQDIFDKESENIEKIVQKDIDDLPTQLSAEEREKKIQEIKQTREEDLFKRLEYCIFNICNYSDTMQA